MFRSKNREKLQAFIDGKSSNTTPIVTDSQEEQRTNSSRYIIRVKIEESQENANVQTYLEGKPADRKRDKTKYSFEGSEWYNKRRFVLEVVKYYVSTHPGVSYETLLRVFPASLHPHKSNGVIKRYNDVLKQIAINPDVRNRFFLKEDEIIELATGMKIVVHNQWGDNIDKFLLKSRNM